MHYISAMVQMKSFIILNKYPKNLKYLRNIKGSEIIILLE